MRLALLQHHFEPRKLADVWLQPPTQELHSHGCRDTAHETLANTPAASGRGSTNCPVVCRPSFSSPFLQDPCGCNQLQNTPASSRQIGGSSSFLLCPCVQLAWQILGQNGYGYICSEFCIVKVEVKGACRRKKKKEKGTEDQKPMLWFLQEPLCVDGTCGSLQAPGFLYEF